jgi:anthranilate/para-aminobenzoate synthase component I
MGTTSKLTVEHIQGIIVEVPGVNIFKHRDEVYVNGTRIKGYGVVDDKQSFTEYPYQRSNPYIRQGFKEDQPFPQVRVKMDADNKIVLLNGADLYDGKLRLVNKDEKTERDRLAREAQQRRNEEAHRAQEAEKELKKKKLEEDDNIYGIFTYELVKHAPDDGATYISQGRAPNEHFWMGKDGKLYCWDNTRKAWYHCNPQKYGYMYEGSEAQKRLSAEKDAAQTS